MRASDLDLNVLFEWTPQGGVMRFAGERVLLFDAVALGLLRAQLIELLGETAARGILTRFGFGHGWRVAEAARDAFEWDIPGEWRAAGGRFHTLKGLVSFEPVEEDGAFAAARWRDSYEAEQHLLHLGQAASPVCWTLCGFASGYLSHAHGERIYCIETQCVGCGDAACHMQGRTRAGWGATIEPHLAYYEQDCLDASLTALTARLKQTERRLRERPATRWASENDGVVAASRAFDRVISLAERVAKVDATVLITGESGVGKEVVARHIHARSPRAHRPFVAINCGALSETLLESELFGHVRGAFTGADRDRVGLFEAAQGGVLFLDEIGEVSQAMQVKLLRVLQEREVRRVGASRVRPVDVRLVAATHRDLAQGVEEGRIRADFYYRLRVVEVSIPPLRARRDDIMPLARRFLSELAAAYHRDVRTIAPAAARALLAYDWPGNVRELRNAIARAVALAEGDRVERSCLPAEVIHESTRIEGAASREDSPRPPRTLAEVEREHILGILEANDGHRAQTAQQLGVSQATLFRRLRQYREKT